MVVFDKLPLRQFNTEQFSIWTFKSIKESNKFPFVKISDKKEFPRPLCYSKTPSGRYMLMKSIFNYFNHWFLVLVWFNLFKRKKIEKLNRDIKFPVLYYSKYFKIHSCIVVKYTVKICIFNHTRWSWKNKSILFSWNLTESNWIHLLSHWIMQHRKYMYINVNYSLKKQDRQWYTIPKNRFYIIYF